MKRDRNVKPDDAAKPSGATIAWPAEWLTQIAFVLALGLVVARATVGDASKLRGESMMSEAPRAAAAGARIGLDLLCCLPALLVLARRVSDREYVMRWSWSVVPLFALAMWGVASVFWAADKYLAVIGACHLVSAAALLWAAAQLVRSWLRLRLVAAIFFGLLLAYLTYSLFHRYLDVPGNRENWEKNKVAILKERDLTEGTFAAEQLGRKVLAGELLGFFTSPNSMAAVIVLLMVVGGGLAVQRIMDDREDRSGYVLGVVAVGAGGWMVLHTGSRTAVVTPVMAAALIGAAWYGRAWLAARSRAAFWAGAGAVVLGAAAVVGHGMYHGTLLHESLTFRWQYWVGSMRIFSQHALLGIGLDNFGWYYPGARLAAAAEEVKDPHNFVVKMLVELGVVGGVILLAWLGRMAWEVTRPVVPLLPVARVAGTRADPSLYAGPRATAGIALIAAVGMLVNVIVSIDFSADGWYVFFEILRRVCMFSMLLIGASVAAVKSLNAPELDARPAPFLLFAMLAALAVFLVHNLIDFSLFEPGGMMSFALLAGCVLGVRQPSVAGRRRRTAAAAVALLVGLVLWLAAGGFVWAPTATAEDSAHHAGVALRTGRPNQAIALLSEARGFQPLNADYALREAQLMIATNAAYAPEALKRLDLAIRTNPMGAEHYLNRARLRARGEDAKGMRDEIKRDYVRVLALNPADAILRVEYADVLVAVGAPEDRAEAAKQYREAIEWNERLKPNEPKRKGFEARLPEIRKKIEALKP